MTFDVCRRLSQMYANCVTYSRLVRCTIFVFRLFSMIYKCGMVEAYRSAWLIAKYLVGQVLTLAGNPCVLLSPCPANGSSLHISTTATAALIRRGSLLMYLAVQTLPAIALHMAFNRSNHAMAHVCACLHSSLTNRGKRK